MDTNNLSCRSNLVKGRRKENKPGNKLWAPRFIAGMPRRAEALGSRRNQEVNQTTADPDKKHKEGEDENRDDKLISGKALAANATHVDLHRR